MQLFLQDEGVGWSSMCRVCGKRFQGSNHKFLLRRHILTHTGERRHACPYCSYQANQAGNLNRHIRNLHPTLVQDLVTPLQVSRSSSHAVILSPMSSHQGILTAPSSVQRAAVSQRTLLQLPLSPRQNRQATDSAPPRSPSPNHGSSRPPLPSLSSSTSRHHFPSLPQLHHQASTSSSTAPSTTATTPTAPVTTVCPE